MSTGFRLDSYLKRIGFSGVTSPDFSTLCALHAAHVNAIPFESLDPLLRRPINLDLVAIQEKLVDFSRGGYCYEQNALFRAALEAIGFSVTGLGGRVRWMSPPGSPLGPKLHMMLKVDLPNAPYLVDVGFGVCVNDAPLKLEPEIEQRTAMGTYKLTKVDGLMLLSAKQPKGWRDMYVFDLEPQLQSDYDLGSWFASTNPILPFTSTLIIERVTSDRRYKLMNRTLTIEARDGKVINQSTIENQTELQKILEDTFAVKPPVPIEEVFARISN